jgi:acetyltransferase-like isoleucine patch superfamily enzyme
VDIKKFIQKACFRLRERYATLIVSVVRKSYWAVQGLEVGSGTVLPQLRVTWPHQVKIGNGCILEDGIYFKFDGAWESGPSIHIGDYSFIGSHCEFNIRKGISIGKNSLIASGCKFIDHDHGLMLDKLIRVQAGPEAPIGIGEDVWLGANVIVLKGVHISSGAVVAAGAVVTKSIPHNEVWAGIPANRIGNRPINPVTKSE